MPRAEIGIWHYQKTGTCQLLYIEETFCEACTLTLILATICFFMFWKFCIFCDTICWCRSAVSNLFLFFVYKSVKYMSRPFQNTKKYWNPFTELGERVNFKTMFFTIFQCMLTYSDNPKSVISVIFCDTQFFSTWWGSDHELDWWFT